MKEILLLLLILCSNHLIAQTQKAATPQSSPSKPVQLEIDKLYEKYKDSKNVTLFTPHGDLEGNVLIEINDNEKPVSIIISGVSLNKSAISEFISNTIKMKLKQGYQVSEVPFGWNTSSYAELVEGGLGFTFKDKNSFQLLMRKGNMYFRVDAGCCVKDIAADIYHQMVNGSSRIRPSNYSWEIETGDTKRKGGKKATTFEF